MADDIETEIPEGEVEETPFELPEGFADTVKGWDIGLDTIPDAVEVYKALQTEEGQIDGFIKLGQSLGFGLREMERLFADEPGAPAPVEATAPTAPAPELPDPDALLTRAEVEELLGQVRGEVTQSFQQQQQAQFQAQQNVVFEAIGGWYGEHEIQDEIAQATIAKLAEKHLAPGANDYDPRVAIAALDAGLAEYEAFVEAEASKRLAAKKAKADAQPTVIGGGATQAGEQGDEPFEYKGGGALQTAKDRVRQRLRDNGQL